MNTRAAFERMLDNTCTIYRPSVTLNEYHERVAELEVFATGVACMMTMPTGRKVVLSAGIDPSKQRLVYFKYDQDIKERDQLDFDGRRYVVNSVDITPKNHHKEAMCETILGG